MYISCIYMVYTWYIQWCLNIQGISFVYTIYIYMIFTWIYNVYHVHMLHRAEHKYHVHMLHRAWWCWLWYPRYASSVGEIHVQYFCWASAGYDAQGIFAFAQFGEVICHVYVAYVTDYNILIYELEYFDMSCICCVYTIHILTIIFWCTNYNILICHVYVAYILYIYWL